MSGPADMFSMDMLLWGLLGHGRIFAQPGDGRHLRVLRRHGLIEEQRPDGDRRGRVYRLRPGSLDPLAGWLDEVRGWERLAGGAEIGRGYGDGARELLAWYVAAAQAG